MNPDNSSISVKTLAGELRAIYNADSSRAETLIEDRLDYMLKGHAAGDRQAFLAELSREFRPPGETGPALLSEREEFFKVISLLLGKDVHIENLSPKELVEKLSQSLNTVFDSLNEIIRVINTTLLGERLELATIRQIIGSGLDAKGDRDSLQNYLDQIKQAFLVAHRAFQSAAGVKIGEILQELDPERISETTGKGLRFGPLRKAENFDIYQEKYAACRKWFESGRAAEEIMREFEKHCQKLYKKNTRSEL